MKPSALFQEKDAMAYVEASKARVVEYEKEVGLGSTLQI